jgi:hypothetical protein
LKELLAVFPKAEGLTTEEMQQLCHHLRADPMPAVDTFLGEVCTCKK